MSIETLIVCNDKKKIVLEKLELRRFSIHF